MKRVPTLIVTQGDPLGIGPEIIIKSLKDKALRRLARWIVIGSRSVFEAERGFESLEKSAELVFLDMGQVRGRLSPRQAGHMAITCLKLAVKLFESGVAQGIVTAPLCKKNAQQAGFKFPGHTEFLAHQLKARHHAMMLFSDTLRVIPVTIHLPLRQVARSLRQENIFRAVLLAIKSLREDFSIRRPRVAVCALNPHAGEQGLMGDEEKRIIGPAIRQAQKKLTRQAVVIGPLAADTLFYKALRQEYDAVVCMYHDQALIPLKATGFESGVNMTLGLPVVRTSPDHGTAFDIAGKGVADPASMKRAMRVVAEIASRRLR